MRGNEFIRKVQRYAKRKGIAFEWRAERGTYHAMLKQLGITGREI